METTLNIVMGLGHLEGRSFSSPNTVEHGGKVYDLEGVLSGLEHLPQMPEAWCSDPEAHVKKSGMVLDIACNFSTEVGRNQEHWRVLVAGRANKCELQAPERPRLKGIRQGERKRTPNGLRVCTGTSTPPPYTVDTSHRSGVGNPQENSMVRYIREDK